MLFVGILERKLTELIEDMNIDMQYDLYNNYCVDNCSDDYVFSNDEYTINDLFSSREPYEILELFQGWDSSWEYILDGIYGFEEWNGIEYVSDVVDYIIRTENNLYNDDIQDLLDKFDGYLDDYIDNLFEDDMTKEEMIESVMDSLEDDFGEDFEDIMEEYENDILEEINNYFTD